MLDKLATEVVSFLLSDAAGGASVAGLEVAVISLGAVVVKSACQLWLGDRQPATDLTSELVDLLAGRVSSRFELRKLGRLFDDCTDIVARRLASLLDAEFGAVPDNEREAAVLAVADTFATARLTDEALFHADLDARLVERQLRPAAAVILPKALLSGGGEQIYWLVLRESCSYLVEVVTTLPKFSSGALTELLRRETAVLDMLSRVLNRLPERRGVDDFAADYRRAVVNQLDRMELFGVTLADENRRYPLSIAYIDLSVLRRASRGGRLVTHSEETGDLLAGSGGLRAEGCLAAALVRSSSGRPDRARPRCCGGLPCAARWLILAGRWAAGTIRCRSLSRCGVMSTAVCRRPRNSRWQWGGILPMRCRLDGCMACCGPGARWCSGRGR
jgi:hypothetical protein